MPPSNAAPSELPIMRISIFDDVATPRVCQLTWFWIETINVVNVSPIPTPIINEPIPAQPGPFARSNVRKNNDPTQRAPPPTIDVHRQPILNKIRPAKVEASTHPTDIIVKGNPAMMAE